MSSVSYQNFITAKHLQDLGYCMITLATCFTVARFVIRGVKRRFYPPEDVVVFLAWACLVSLCIGYIIVTPAVYRISAVGSGAAPPYATIKEDADFLVRIFFPNTLLLWCCLWLVKAALLLQCRRLIEQQRNYIRVWWAIVGFTFVVFIGCVVTEFTSCRTLHDWFTFGQCQTPRDARASQISLYYAFAVDLITDLMIMVFPVRILWNLRISRLRKLMIMGIFCVGIIGICTSIVRISQITSKSKSRQPSPSWLEVWAMVEAAIAVVVACLPTFGLFFPSVPSRTGYARSNYHANDQSGTAQSRTRHKGDRSLRDEFALRPRFPEHDHEAQDHHANETYSSNDGLGIKSSSLNSDAKVMTTTVDAEDNFSRKTTSSEQQVRHIV